MKEEEEKRRKEKEDLVSKTCSRRETIRRYKRIGGYDRWAAK